MGYFGSEGIYDSNLSFWGKKFKKKFWTQRNFWRMHQQQLNKFRAEINITFDPVKGFGRVRGHFGVIFHDQFNGQVSVQISWHEKKNVCNFGTS